jgi:hypothetical protein
LNAGKCKFISFSRRSKPVLFQYAIGDSDLKRFDVINDFGVLIDSRMTFVNHVESIVSISARILGLHGYASCVWSPYQEVHSARIERIQHNFIRFAL